jgi:hypothetical protein
MLPFPTRRYLSYLPIMMRSRGHIEGVSASPIAEVIVPRTHLSLCGDPIFAEGKVCIETASMRSTRALRGEVLSVWTCCCCCHVYTILCASLGNARAAAEAAAAAEEDHTVAGRYVGNIPESIDLLRNPPLC